MKVAQAAVLPPALLEESKRLGDLLARLRSARAMKQSEAALRAGVSRNTAYRLERGDPGIAIGQVLRYLDAIAPGASLASLYAQTDPALKAQAMRERTQRVRDMTASERDELDF